MSQAYFANLTASGDLPAEVSAFPSRRLGVLAGLVIVLWLAAALYLNHINAVSFWQDESWMAVAVEGDLPGVWAFAAREGVHPPGYFLLGWGYVRLAGDGELALRWLAGLCALLGIAGTYRLGADWYGPKAGAYAALLTAGSLFLIYFARLARQYTAFFALAVALVWAYERWRRHPRRRGWWAALVALQAALLYTHYFGVWMALVLGLHGALFLPTRREKAWLAGGLALSGLLFLPWVPAALEQFLLSGEGLGYAIRDADWALVAYLDRVFNGSTLLGLGLLALGIYATWRRRQASTGALLALWLVVPLGLSLAFNARFAWFVERNMIFTLGAAYVLFGAGLAWVDRLRRGRWVAMAAALVFVALGLARYEVFWPYITPDWRDIAHAMAWDARPDDVFVVSGEPYTLHYYLRRYLGRTVAITNLEAWLAHDGQPDRVWLTGTQGAVRFEAIDALPPGMAQTRRYVLGVLVTEFYQRPPQEPLTVFGGQLALGLAESPIRAAVRPGETLTLDLWWRAVRQPEADYSVGVYLVGADGAVLAQQDGGFDGGRVSAPALPTDRWTPDARALAIPPDAPPGEYDLLLSAYDWRDQSRLAPEGGRPDDLYPLGVATVEAGVEQ